MSYSVNGNVQKLPLAMKNTTERRVAMVLVMTNALKAAALVRIAIPWPFSTLVATWNCEGGCEKTTASYQSRNHMVTERGGGSWPQEHLPARQGINPGGPKSTVNAKYSDSNHEGGAQYGSDVDEEDHDDAREDMEA
ncbi:hypothetical protein RHSIM_Rhsim06G0098400 [Rhododendron simsii]|uniref:Uncharacterized protein n=1 Tax=Rhododendron simsii TaxID=118357 RepID=A0A834LMT9_RHOSS|nr:hypothetical protein RHSIM_Rhsim06G0098400 [Rhododendron simsii]